MPAVVCGLSTALLQRQKLVAEIEKAEIPLAAQFEVEESAVERQRLFDVTDLER